MTAFYPIIGMLLGSIVGGCVALFLLYRRSQAKEQELTQAAIREDQGQSEWMQIVALVMTGKSDEAVTRTKEWSAKWQC